MTFVSKSSGSIMISAIVSSISMLGNFASLGISEKYFLFMSENISKGSTLIRKLLYRDALDSYGSVLKYLARFSIISPCYLCRLLSELKSFKLIFQNSPLIIQNIETRAGNFCVTWHTHDALFWASCITVNKEKQNKWLKNQAAPRSWLFNVQILLKVDKKC